MRLVVLGFASEHAGFEPGYEFALIGSTASSSDGIDLKIGFLKSATLLTQLNGKPVSDEALLEALALLQKKVENKFSKGMREISVEWSQVVSREQLDAANVDIICQDPTLSMPGPGRRMLVIKKDLIEQNGRQLLEIDPMEFHALLDIAASTYDIENTETKPGTADRKLQWRIQQSEGFRLGRTAIQSRM